MVLDPTKWLGWLTTWLDIRTVSAIAGVVDDITPNDTTEYSIPFRTLVGSVDDMVIYVTFVDDSVGRVYLPRAGFESIAIQAKKIMLTNTDLNSGILTGYK